MKSIIELVTEERVKEYIHCWAKSYNPADDEFITFNGEYFVDHCCDGSHFVTVECHDAITGESIPMVYHVWFIPRPEDKKGL